MNRKPGFIIVIIVFIVAIASFYFFLKKQQNPGIEPLNAVPINAAAIIELKKPLKFYNQVSQKNAFFKKLNNISDFAQFTAKIANAYSLIVNNQKLNDLFSHKSLVISIHDIGKNEFKPLFVMPVKGWYESNQIFKSIEADCSGKYTFSFERYNQVKLFKISDESSHYFYSYHNGLLIGSTSEMLVEDALRQVESTSNLLVNSSLKRLKETSGDHAEANIYIQFKYFQSYIGRIVSAAYLKNLSINQIGDWLEFDLNLKNQTLLFNGFAFSQSSDNRFMNLFQGQQPQNIKFLNFVPAGAEAFMGFELSNYSLYKENLRKYMEQIGQVDRYEINNKKIRDVFGNNSDKDLDHIFSGEIAQVTLANKSALFYIRTNGYRDASELIDKWLKNYCSKNNESLGEFKFNYKIDEESVFPIYKMPIEYVPARLFGPFFKLSKANYVTVFDDFIIFGDDQKTLSNTIYNNVLQKTMVYDGGFTQFADYLSTKVNYYGYLSLTGTGESLRERLSNKAYVFYKNNQELLRDFYGIGWQFATENNMYYNNLLFRHQPTNTLKAATEWETRLDTVIAFKPALMKNHYTNEKEIFVQDEKYNVYLINHSGRVLWKKNIGACIMGEVFQVDYFKNGKLQYLFNTKEKIHLLDRNGNFVKRYPINLPDKAVAPLAVFDYENRKNYRLFIPLASKEILAYNIEGKKVSGFKFSGADNKIISSVQYVRDNNKDYIIVTDESRIYLLDRRGNTRATPKMDSEPSKNNIFSYQPGNNNRPGRLVRTDSKGTIYYIYFDGKVEKKQIQECSGNHFFNVEDVNDDRINDFVFVDKNELTVYSLTGKRIFNHTFSTDIKHAPSFYRFSSNKTFIGITEFEANKIYLFNGKGEISKGFPLLGRTRFSIGFLEPGSGLFNLVVGGDEYYLYNFKLN
ncbi:MAG: hypothetical protein PF517_09730 [Salinivirgaceae bacterium]|jgi:hypothetical protein|nr:hypothetical protein [Salinivirgaceae bacterium]